MNLTTLHYLPTAYGTYSPNTEKEPDTPVQLDSRQQAAVDALLLPGLSDKARQKCNRILSKFPSGVLENLKKHGLSIEITQGKPLEKASGNSVALGGYNMLTRRITFDEAVLMSGMGTHVVTHETCHAIDHMRGLRHSAISHVPVLKNSWILTGGSPMDSSKDKELLKIYARYQARGAVEDADQLRNEVKLVTKDGSLPPTAKIDGADNWGPRTLDYSNQNGTETFKINDPEGAGLPGMATARKMARGGAILGAAAVATGVFLAMPWLAVVGGGMCLLFAPRAIGEKIKDLRTPAVKVDVDLQQGKKATVEHKGGLSTVTMPTNAPAFTGDVWSDYAHRADKSEEYYAEALSGYIEGGTKQRDLKDYDPDMYAYVDKTLKAEFARETVDEQEGIQ